MSERRLKLGDYSELEAEVKQILYRRVKSDAKQALEEENFSSAVTLFTEAIYNASILYQGFHNEILELYSKRSFAYTQLGMYERALDDADFCIKCECTWPEAYIRKACALNGMKRQHSALKCFVHGYKLCVERNLFSQIKDFLREIVTGISCIKDDGDAVNILATVEDTHITIPPSLINDVVHQLVTRRQWEEVSLMVLGIHSGPSSRFDRIACNVSAAGLSVENLIKTLFQMPNDEWRYQLANALLSTGASTVGIDSFIQELEIKERKPVVFIVIETTFQTGKTHMLKFSLANFITTKEAKNAQDSDGNTALHHLVQSGKLNTTLGETILRIVLNHGFSVFITNNLGKLPIHYLNEYHPGYRLLREAENKKVEDIKMKIIELKNEGNRLLASDTKAAIEKYSTAIDICEIHEAFKPELPILLTNRAKAYEDRQDYEKALKDAEFSIEINSEWSKGYWRKGRNLKSLNRFEGSFDAFYVGYSIEKKVSFIYEAVALLEHITQETKKKLYKKLRVFDISWSDVLKALSKKGQWSAIGTLVFGTSVDEIDFKPDVNGIAANVTTTGIDFSSVFSFLRQQKDYTLVSKWFPKLLTKFLLPESGLLNAASFKENEDDTPVHSAVKFSLLTGSALILKEQSFNVDSFDIVDKRGNSVFHIITKNPWTKNKDVLVEVSKILLEKRFYPNIMDKDKKTPIDYLRPDEDRDLYRIFISFKGQRKSEWLKGRGNIAYKDDNIALAKDIYTKAIELTPSSDIHHLSRLYGNRTECWLKLKENTNALRDALTSLDHDCQWYKGSFRMGKVYSAMGKYNKAVQYFTTSFNLLDSNATETLKKSILFEFAIHSTRLNRHKNFTSINFKIPVTPDLWAKTSYDLVCAKKMEAGKMAFEQIRMLEADSVQVQLDLGRLCTTGNLEKHKWLINFIMALLELGSDPKTLTLKHEEIYFHAVVKMTLEVGLYNLLHCVINKYVIPKNELDILDNNGNTVLHAVAMMSSYNPNTWFDVINILLNYGIDTLKENNQKKCAIDLLPKKEGRCKKIIQKKMSEQKEKKRQEQMREEAQQKTATETEQKNTKSLKEDGQSCQNCEKHLENSFKYTRQGNIGQSCVTLAKVLNHKDRRIDHNRLFDKSVEMLIDNLERESNPAIPEQLTKIPVGLYQKMIEGLVEKQAYNQMDVAVAEYRKYNGASTMKNFAKGINIAKVICKSTQIQQDRFSEIIGNLLKSGAVITEGNSECIPVAIDMKLYKILCLLINHGANPLKLTLRPGDTPLHAALSIALVEDEGNFDILNKLLDMYEENPDQYRLLDPNQTDQEGDSLFHLLAKMNYSDTIKRAMELLHSRNVSAFKTNFKGELPVDHLIHNDPRLQLFQLFSADSGNSTHKCLQNDNGSRPESENDMCGNTMGGREDPRSILENTSSNQSQRNKAGEKSQAKQVNREVIREKVKVLISNLPDDQDYNTVTTPPASTEEMKSRKTETDETRCCYNPLFEADKVHNNLPESKSDESSDTDQEVEADQDIKEMTKTFDDLVWEIECTDDFWKTLRSKHVLQDLKRRAINKLRKLGSGEWGKALCKPLKTNISSLKLYEAKLSKGSRIIWELAIEFSPSRSESAEKRLMQERATVEDIAVKGGRIYSEIIRVWDIVLKHDNIHRSVEKICKSYLRGRECIIQKKLTGIEQTQFEKNGGIRYPITFTENESGNEITKQTLYPPASPNEIEYHILKFYSFSPNLVQNILQNIHSDVDFPFRVTDLEHAIIHVKSDAPILLLGRSGTGKTTCCLYRLWSLFSFYWQKTESDSPILPRSVRHVAAVDDAKKEDEDCTQNCSQVNKCVAQEQSEEEENQQEQKYDHLQQIFITKNPVLCTKVKENFSNMRHAYSIATNHEDDGEDTIPPRLQDVKYFQYPLFITSKKLLLMLDASLDKPFFKRDEDGNLKDNVEGWTEKEEEEDISSLLREEFDDEEGPDDDEENVIINYKQQDLRREVTYEVFTDEVWPRIAKDDVKTYQPSLIWTEILSFIKGSYEALLKDTGVLDEKEYMDFGRKKAPYFIGEREQVYKIYRRYHSYLRNNNLFDEFDLVHHIYKRLKSVKEIEWVIHQIYVDETQDFSQAELFLFLLICQNPNDMFLTGDTAQGIMRGIFFRFKDLRSLYHCAKESTKGNLKINVPKTIHKLTLNYRSHSGIINLASSVIDLMEDFFPESFDRLPRDQGLFKWPLPVLLESCSFSDLAVLLRGNKRETSHIELGAHQAVIVVNETARQNIPDELSMGVILTIYEAKGLEFDDILLYNFFKDSQAKKEWLVVTDVARKQNSLPYECQTSSENLTEIDAVVLEGKKPRMLKFDPNKHKLLNSELKHLYTAITRARVNVWIYDEDQENRKPMFKYFKDRNLVESFTSKDMEDGNIDKMFAKESSQEDWIESGEKFMKKKLYKVAEKCFKRADNIKMVKKMQAFQQVMVAIYAKENRQHMRHEYLIAAEKCLDCRLIKEAIKCLRNANEKMLLAQLLEKLHQLKQAADIYRRLNSPLDQSRCYEKRGLFRQAIEILSISGLHDMAIKARHRYDDLKLEDKEKIQAPSDKQSVERLSYQAAEKHLKDGRKEECFEMLEKLSPIIQVDFFKKHEMFQLAAELLVNEGNVEESVDLYLTHGFDMLAVELARDKQNEKLLARSLLVQVRRYLCSDQKESEETTRQVENIKKVISIAGKLRDRNLKGEAQLLKGEMTRDIKDINASFGSFIQCKPRRNEAGQLECMHWMVYNSELDQIRNCKQVVKGMQNLFEVLDVLLSQSDYEKERRLEKIYKYYGFETVNQDTEILKVYPKLYPRALKMISGLNCGYKNNKNELEIPKYQIKIHVCQYLLKNGFEWMKQIDCAIEDMRQKRISCASYLSGDENEEMSRSIFSPESQNSMRELLEVDAIMVELDSHIINGAKRLLKKAPVDLQEKIQVFLMDKFRFPISELRSCQLLLQDMIPRCYQPWQVFEQTESCSYVRRHIQAPPIKDIMFKYLRSKYDDILDHDKTMITNHFVKLIFLSRYFNNLKEVNPSIIMFQLEKSVLEKEAALGNYGSKLRELKSFGFMLPKDTKSGQPSSGIQCIAKRFLQGIEQLADKKDAMESITFFTTFVVILGQRNRAEILPEFHEFLLWLEFYTFVGMCFAVKFKPGIECFVPSSHISTVSFVDSAFGQSTYELIKTNKQKCDENSFTFLQSRIRRILSLLCGDGFDIKLNLLAVAFDTKNHIVDYLVAERLIVLCLTCLCNMGKSIAIDKETHIMQMLCRIELKDDFPPRLTNVITYLKEAKGQRDLFTALKELLWERNNENIQICAWQDNHYGIRRKPVQNDSFFSTKFLNENTSAVVSNPQTQLTHQKTSNGNIEDASDDTEMTKDEIIMQEMKKKQLEDEQKKEDAIQTFKRFRNRVKFIRKCEKLHILLKKQIEIEIMEERELPFTSVSISDTMCGYCGVTFSDLSSEPWSPTEYTYMQIYPLAQRQHSLQGFQEENESLPTDYENRSIQNDPFQQRIVHEHTPDHQQNIKDFLLFKSKYLKEMASTTKEIYDFTRKYLPDTVYSDDLQIRSLIREQEEFQKRFKLIFQNQSWKDYEGLTQIVSNMETIYNSVRKEIETQHKTHEENQKQRHSIEASANNVANVNDDEEPIDEVIKLPKKSRKRHKFRKL